jgi:serine/threonine-protein kinase
MEDFQLFDPLGAGEFIKALQQRLYSRDLYDLPTAATRSEDFFGRRSMVTETATRLRTGGRHIGLFGLRKIGKTSFLYRLQSMLRNGDSCIVAHVDIERIDAIEPSAEHLLWSLGEAIYDSHRQVRRVEGLLLFGRYRLYSQVEDKGALFELFDHDIRIVLSSTRRKLVLMFDEIEILSTRSQQSSWGASFVRIWRLLRGLDQQIPERLSYFVTGTNPSMFEHNRLHGLENPVYNYFSIQYLRPLSFDDVSNLITTLGRRMGLEWQDDAVARVYETTGGHPALVRGLASLVHKSAPTRQTRKSVRLIDVNSAANRFLVDRASLLSQLVAVLQEEYPDEFHLLELLAGGQIGEFREYAEAFPEDTAHLNGYGLLDGEVATCTSLEIELLHTFLQRKGRERSRLEAGSVSPVAIGDEISGYRIHSTAGQRGGFAQVYRATASDGQTVAIKVFENGRLSALQRELEPLQEIDHPHVVNVLDFGTADNGVVYMVMEFLDGKSLRYFCTRSTRVSEEQAFEWLEQLLDAFATFHPDEARVRDLRARGEISLRELAELEEARHGFIHRDVKPENVIASDRGAVLIDFNISSRASSQVVTTSFTPGYLPPDGAGHIWTPDLDLYQLGITFLQICLGVTCDNQSGVRDLRLLAKEELRTPLGLMLLRMSHPDRSERFASAKQALEALERSRRRGAADSI